MARKMNYEDNITFLNARLTDLIRGLSLPVDPQLFADAVDREINFLSVTLGRVHKSIDESSFSMNRRQVLIDLRVLMILFVDLLDGIRLDRYPIATALDLHKPRYGRMREAARDQIATVERWIREADDDTPERSYMVSEEEMMGLLTEDGPIP
jgi:hypothetical protein